jgi:predicted MFS family arabinose efflux permease
MMNRYISYKLLYLLLFSGFGILFPYLPVFYESLLLSKSRIGVLCMLPKICSFLTGPLFSIISDVYQAEYEVLMISLITSTILTIAVLPFSSFAWIFLITLLSSVTRSPLTSQLDALLMSALDNKTRYGEVRLWGAISFGVLSLFGGVLTDDRSSSTSGLSWSEGLRYRCLFYLHGLFSLLTGILLLFILNQIEMKKVIELFRSSQEVPVSVEDGDGIPRSVSEENQPSETLNPKKISPIQALKQVYQDHPEITVFSLIVFLSGFGAGVIDAFLFVRLGQLGGTGTIMGISRFITCASEVPMFRIAGSLQQKYGIWPVMALTQIAYVIRFIYYSTLTIPWLVLPCEILHGLTFAVMWSVSCSYASLISTPECHATIQALLKGLHYGLGSAMGALIGGFIYDSYGAVSLFEGSAWLACFSFFLSVWMIYKSRMHCGVSMTDSSEHPDTSHYKQLELGPSRIDIERISNPLILSTRLEEDDEERGDAQLE